MIEKLGKQGKFEKAALNSVTLSVDWQKTINNRIPRNVSVSYGEANIV